MKDLSSPTELSRRAGISKSFAFHILRGDRVPAQPMALKIWRATGLKFGDLAKLNDDEIAVIEKVHGQ